MNEFENNCEYNLAETCVASLTVEELLDIAGLGRGALDEVLSMRLTYGAIEGSMRLRTAIAALYEGVRPEQILVTHGAIGANKLVHETIVEPGDGVVSVQPTYQQHYSIPESYGADVQILMLRPDNDYLPDLGELRRLVSPNTSLIAINNPNNPTGSLMDAAMLTSIGEIAASVWGQRSVRRGLSWHRSGRERYQHINRRGLRSWNQHRQHVKGILARWSTTRLDGCSRRHRSGRRTAS